MARNINLSIVDEADTNKSTLFKFMKQRYYVNL